MRKINIDNSIFIIGFFLLTISNLLCRVRFLQNYFVMIRFVAYLLLILDILIVFKNNTINFKKLFSIFVFFCFSIYIYYYIGDAIFVDFSLVALSCFNKDFKQILKYDLYIKIFVTILILLSYFIGLSDTLIVMRVGKGIRNSFGFYHPNTFGMYIMMIYFEFILIYKNRHLINLFIGILLIFLIDFTSNSRTAEICIVLMCLFNIYYYKSNNKLMKVNFLKNSYLISSVLSFIATYLFSIRNSFGIMIDNLFSYRIYYQLVNYKKIGFNLLGSDLDIIFTLDNGFFKILIKYGFVSFVFFMIVFYLSFDKSKRKNSQIFYLLLVLCYYTFSESSMFYIYYNIFLVYIFCKGVIDDEKSISNNSNI